MSLMDEYIKKKLTVSQYEEELLSLISKYNKEKNTFLLVFYTFTEKPLPPKLVMLSQEDYYTINDLLHKKGKMNSLDIYLESPGGRGETAKELADLFHSYADEVNFLTSGEAKSAATILVLSGNNILMTKTGSLGPIDAQVTIRDRTVSSFDYMQWINDKRKEAEEIGKLNTVDVAIVSRIIPGELLHVFNALEFAKDCVREWLPKYKFKNWKVRETTKKQVTPKFREDRADEVANYFVDREKWRLHQMSIKRDDLKDILKIEDIDKYHKLSELVYRIQTVCRLICTNSNSYKIFATKKYKIFRQAGQAPSPPKLILPKGKQPTAAKIKADCPKCGRRHKLYGKFIDDPKIDKQMKAEGAVPFPKDNKLICDCGFEFNLIAPRSELEKNIGKKML